MGPFAINRPITVHWKLRRQMMNIGKSIRCDRDSNQVNVDGPRRVGSIKPYAFFIAGESINIQPGLRPVGGEMETGPTISTANSSPAYKRRHRRVCVCVCQSYVLINI